MRSISGPASESPQRRRRTVRAAHLKKQPTAGGCRGRMDRPGTGGSRAGVGAILHRCRGSPPRDPTRMGEQTDPRCLPPDMACDGRPPERACDGRPPERASGCLPPDMACAGHSGEAARSRPWACIPPAREASGLNFLHTPNPAGPRSGGPTGSGQWHQSRRAPLSSGGQRAAPARATAAFCLPSITTLHRIRRVASISCRKPPAPCMRRSIHPGITHMPAYCRFTGMTT